MSFTILNCEQRSTEWHAARLGRVTGSCANDLLATVKTGEAAARRNLRVRLVLERITGRSGENDFVSSDMQHGIDTEQVAAAMYQALTGRLISRVGFLQHRSLMAGCSPDGVIGDFEGLVSIKCPKSATHLEALRTERVPTEYLRQLTHELFISGAQWCDYLSFDNRFPPELQTKLIRVDAESLDLDGYGKTLHAFLKEVEDEQAAVLKLIAQKQKAVA